MVRFLDEGAYTQTRKYIIGHCIFARLLLIPVKYSQRHSAGHLKGISQLYRTTVAS